MKKTLVLLAIVAVMFSAGAANSEITGTTYTINNSTVTQTTGFTPAGTLVGGDTLIIPSSWTNHLYFIDVNGSSGNPITITNPSTARVSITEVMTASPWGSISFVRCRYMVLDGSNYASETYGICVKNGHFGIRIYQTEDLEIKYAEITSVGIQWQDGEWDAAKDVENLQVHHCYIHNVSGEGIYLGKSNWVSTVNPSLKDCKVYSNIIENCGWDGIQLCGADEGTNEVYDNYCKNLGTAGVIGQITGIIFPPGTTGNIYRNTVINAYGSGIYIQGAAKQVDIHDNVVIDSGTYGISVNTGKSGNSIINNTVVNSNPAQTTWKGIYAYGTTDGEVRYNLVVGAGNAGAISTSYSVNQDNLTSTDVAGQYFVDVNNDNVRLTSASPARDYSSNAGYSPTDLDGTTRPIGTNADAGAFEYLGQTTTYYVKNGGNNALDGLSDGNAWETIGKVNGINFANDDVVQLKRGSTFTDATLTLDATSVGRSGITVQDYGTGDKPRIDGNVIRPIRINHALVNLTVKNIDVSGSDTSEVRAAFENINGLTIDGLDYDGHAGSVSYIKSDCIQAQYVAGNIEIKNCTIQNLMKDTFANTLSMWGSNDAVGIIFWYPGDENVKTSGTVSIHDNIIHDVYTDCIHLGGIHTTTNIYNNKFYNFGENAIDMKYSRYIDAYNNDMYQNDYGAAEGSGYFGPTAIGSGDATQWTSTYMPRDNIVRNNYIHTSPYIGVASPGENATIKNNYFKNLGNAITIIHSGAQVYNNIIELNTGIPEVEPYSSRWVDTTLSGIRIDKYPKNSANIYGNTFYMSSNDHLYGIAVQADASATGTIIKNNIIHMARNDASVFPICVYDCDDSGNLPTIQYNELYGAHSNRVYIEETPGNFVTYDSTEQTEWRDAGHHGALFTNPLFTNPATGDLTLQPTSPAINAGTNLGSPYNLGLNPNSTWPNNVSTLDQNNYGTGWEIGAYVWSEHLIGDLDGDGCVDIADLSMFVEFWLQCNDPQNPDCEFPF